MHNAIFIQSDSVAQMDAVKHISCLGRGRKRFEGAADESSTKLCGGNTLMLLLAATQAITSHKLEGFGGP